jgi:predicted DCC family thiol-disulfide oxidoreductase YuxK
MSRVTVFFDGKCGLCRQEIGYYRRIVPRETFEWVDIASHAQPLLDLGITVQDGLKILHVKNRDGQIFQGVDGFLLIWENIPRFRWLSRIIRLRPFYPIAVFLYLKFATWRFARMGYQKCDI